MSITNKLFTTFIITKVSVENLSVALSIKFSILVLRSLLDSWVPSVNLIAIKHMHYYMSVFAVAINAYTI